MHSFLLAYAGVFSNPIQDMAYCWSLSAAWAFVAVWGFFVYMPARVHLKLSYATSNRAAMNSFNGPISTALWSAIKWYAKQVVTDVVDRLWCWLNSEVLFNPKQSVMI